MPHLSKKQIPPKVKGDLEKQIITLLSSTGTRERNLIFNELFTDTEKIVFAKRLALISLINQDLPTHEISEQLGISTSTVSRFELLIHYKKYTNTSKWVKRNSLESRVNQLIGFVIASAFGKRGKSFSKMIKDL